MQRNTLEWAKGLRAGLRAEIAALLSAGVATSETLARVMTFRTRLLSVDALIASLEATQQPQVL